MFLAPLTLQNVAQLLDPREKVSLGEHTSFEEGLILVAEDSLEGYELLSAKDESLQLHLFLHDSDLQKGLTVKITEADYNGALDFQCSHCATNGDSKNACAHQWASFAYLWKALKAIDEDSELADPRLNRLSRELKGSLYLRQAQRMQTRNTSSQDVTLESVSLFLEDMSLEKEANLTSLLKSDFTKYKAVHITKDQESLAPMLWNMPEVFRRKLTAYSEFYFNEVNELNRLADLVRYNFSNGQQISAKEILRSPLYKNVPKDLLPQPKSPQSIFAHWPLTQRKEHLFISQNLRELEEIMQSLLGHIGQRLKQGHLDLYIQTKVSPGRALPIRELEFDPTLELDWRVEFAERKQLETEFKLISLSKSPLYFFESFAVDLAKGMLIVHPWYNEWSLLEEVIASLPEENVDVRMLAGEMPLITCIGELETKALLKHFRSRSIPVKISGESRTLGADQSMTEIQMDESGAFYVQHRARVTGQKDLIRRGWTPRSTVYLKTLSEGLPFLLNTEARDAATKSRRNREWDLKLLKHLGVLQYVFVEALSYHFNGELTDGRIVSPEEIFPAIHEKVHTLLLSGTGVVLARDMTLKELCSRTVLRYFEDFISKTLNTVKQNESFYSEQGEVVLEGVVEREFRLIYEILKNMALTTGGESFKKSRTPLLGKIWTGDPSQDPYLETGLFHLSKISKEGPQVHDTLEAFQPLLTQGFQLYYKGQPLQELNDEDFFVDFSVQGDVKGPDFNWFELNPKFFLRGEEIDPQEMNHFGSSGVIEHEGKLYLVPPKQMPSLRRLENFWLKLQKGQKESSRKKSGEKVYQLPRHQILELLALRASGHGIRGDEEWKKICEFYDGLGLAARDFKLPKSVKAELKPYQERGVQWLQDLYNLRLGALLADDMGLGKTLQTLTFLEHLREQKELGQVLIVVPSSLIFNWQSEVEKFTPKLPLTVFSNRDIEKIGKKLEAKEDLVVLTTYGLLMEHEQFLSQYRWKVLIFDEAQNLKNITTKRTSAARSLAARFKICLTGTPMENHYGEFYSLVDILVPGSLGRIEDFRRQFVNTEIISKEQIEDLKLKMRPLMLRRTKKEILDQLPEKQETKVSIAFEERQMEIYRDIALSYNEKVQEGIMAQGEARVQLQMLTALLRLRQACSDPGALPNVRYDKVPPKLETLVDSLQEVVESGESALVFTQFLQTLEHAAKILDAANIPVFVLHGGVPTKQRQKILAEFNKMEGGAVLLMTLKTGGVGLNLTKASYVFHLEPWWNPSVENQATDRAHRLGQNKAVQVFRYIMHESLEEKIELLKNRKDKKFKVLFSTAEKEVDLDTAGAGLSKADFDFLLGIK